MLESLVPPWPSPRDLFSGRKPEVRRAGAMTTAFPMPASRVVRPVVRSYQPPHFERAADWVRAGGHALVWIAQRKARLVFARPRDGDEHDLGWWSVLDLGATSFSVAKRGPFAT